MSLTAEWARRWVALQVCKQSIDARIAFGIVGPIEVPPLLRCALELMLHKRKLRMPETIVYVRKAPALSVGLPDLHRRTEYHFDTYCHYRITLHSWEASYWHGGDANIRHYTYILRPDNHWELHTNVTSCPYVPYLFFEDEEVDFDKDATDISDDDLQVRGRSSCTCCQWICVASLPWKQPRPALMSDAHMAS